MSMAHLDPQDPSVFEALQDVMDPKTDTNWFASFFNFFFTIQPLQRSFAFLTGECDVLVLTIGFCLAMCPRRRG